jgi:hypothetical protein
MRLRAVPERDRLVDDERDVVARTLVQRRFFIDRDHTRRPLQKRLRDGFLRDEVAAFHEAELLVVLVVLDVSVEHEHRDALGLRFDEELREQARGVALVPVLFSRVEVRDRPGDVAQTAVHERQRERLAGRDPFAPFHQPPRAMRPATMRRFT